MQALIPQFSASYYPQTFFLFNDYLICYYSIVLKFNAIAFHKDDSIVSYLFVPVFVKNNRFVLASSF